MNHFYEEQLHRMEAIQMEAVNFLDILCQMYVSPHLFRWSGFDTAWSSKGVDPDIGASVHSLLDFCSVCFSHVHRALFCVY